MPVSSSLFLSLSLSFLFLFVALCSILGFSNFNFKTLPFCFAKILGFHSPSPRSFSYRNRRWVSARAQRFGPRTEISLGYQLRSSAPLANKSNSLPLRERRWKTKNQSCPFSLCVNFDFFGFGLFRYWLRPRNCFQEMRMRKIMLEWTIWPSWRI